MNQVAVKPDQTTSDDEHSSIKAIITEVFKKAGLKLVHKDHIIVKPVRRGTHITVTSLHTSGITFKRLMRLRAYMVHKFKSISFAVTPVRINMRNCLKYTFIIKELKRVLKDNRTSKEQTQPQPKDLRKLRLKSLVRNTERFHLRRERKRHRIKKSLKPRKSMLGGKRLIRSGVEPSVPDTLDLIRSTGPESARSRTVFDYVKRGMDLKDAIDYVLRTYKGSQFGPKIEDVTNDVKSMMRRAHIKEPDSLELRVKSYLFAILQR